MKVIIAGSRPPSQTRHRTKKISKWYQENYPYVQKAVKDSKFDIEEVVCGKAKGFDHLGEAWATENRIPIKPFPAEWDRLGYKAGLIRNEQMAEYADALIALTLGTPGTAHMVRTMKRLGKPVFVVDLRPKAYRPNPTQPKRRPWIAGASSVGLKSSGELGAQRRKPDGLNA